MDDFNIIDIEKTEPSKKVKITGKRKAPETEDKETLKSKCRCYCKTPEEWSNVCRMTEKQLVRYIEQKSFECDTNLSSSVMDGLHKFYAIALDTITGSNGHVQTQILADESLKESLRNEAIPLLSYLNNKLKIALLTSNNVVQGKMIQKASEPQIEEIKQDQLNGAAEEDHQTDSVLADTEDLPIQNPDTVAETNEEGEESDLLGFN